MKQLLNGVAIAAVLALATPALAQSSSAPMSPSTPPSNPPAAGNTMAPASPTTSSTKPMHHPAMHHAATHPAMHHAAMRRSPGSSGGDRMTEQLNQQELQQLQSGGSLQATPASSSGGMQGGQMQGGQMQGGQMQGGQMQAPAPGASAPPPPSR